MPMDRLHEILHRKKEFLDENETLILVKDEEMTALYHDGDSLCEVHGEINEKLNAFLNWLYDDNQYY